MLESVSDIRKKYYSAKYQIPEEQKKIDIDAIIADLKKDKKFNKFTDDQLVEYAYKLIAQRRYQALELHFKSALPDSGQPQDAMWSQYSAEEIIAMEEIGVNVPQEFLDWAHSMNDSDTVSYEIELATEDENSFENLDAQDSDLVKSDITKKTQKLTTKAIAENQLLKDTVNDTLPMSKDLEKKQADIVKTQNLSVKKIEDMQKEFTELDDRIKASEELSDDDYKRYKELGLLLSDTNNNFSSEIKAISSDIDKLVEQMDLVSNLININDKIDTELDDMTRRLAPMEAGRDKQFLPNQKFNIVSGMTANFYYSSLGNDLSVQTTLINENIKSDTADAQNKINVSNLADKIFSEKITEALSNIVQPEGNSQVQNNNPDISENSVAEDEIQPQVEDETGEEQPTEDVESAETKGNEENQENSELNFFERVGLDAQSTIGKVEQAGETSEKYGQDALKEAGLIEQEEEKVEDKVAEVEVKASKAQEDLTTATTEAQPEEVVENPENIEESPEIAEDNASSIDEASQEVASVNSELADVNEEGLTIEEKFQRYLQNNDKFKDLKSDAEGTMVETNLYGDASTALGVLTIAEGTELIALASSIGWLQPALAAFLIKIGTAEIVLGTGFVEIGVDLIATSIIGFEACGKTEKQIKGSDKNIDKATKKIKEEDKLDEVAGEDGKEPVEGEELGNDEGVVATQNSSKSKKEKEEVDEGDAGKVEDQGKDTAKEGEESKKLGEKNLKDKAKTDKEIKNTENSLKAEAKRINTMTAQSQKMNSQIDKMNSEALEIQAQQSQQQSAPVQTTSANKNSVGITSNSSITSTGNNDNSVQNAARLQTISTTTGQLQKRITKNISNITKIERTSQKQIKKLNKNYQIKHDAAQAEIKSQQEKDAKAEKFQGVVTKVGLVFTGVKIAGQIMSKILTPPWVAAAGAAMFIVGKYGEVSCYVTNAAVDVARGNYIGAAINIGAAALSFASGPIKLEGAGDVVKDAAKAGAEEIAKESTAEAVTATAEAGVETVAEEGIKDAAEAGLTSVAEDGAVVIAETGATTVVEEGAKQGIKGALAGAKETAKTYIKDNAKDMSLKAGQSGLSYLEQVQAQKEAEQDDGQVKEKRNRKVLSFQEKKARQSKLRKIEKSNKAALRKRK